MKSSKSPSRRLRQSTLNVPTSGVKTCSKCGMSYHASLPQDQKIHAKLHATFTDGLNWKISSADAIKDSFQLRENISKNDVRIVEILKDSAYHKACVEKLLVIVNQELNAPSGNNAWKSHTDSKVQGKAFVVIIKARAVGVCITEPIKDLAKQARWMLYRNQEIVPDQVNSLPILGISRIWVASRWRRHGLGLRMLDCVRKHLVYGMTIKPVEIAFSQPSCAGGKLAKQFNGVKHKSGEILLLVYLEQDSTSQ